MPNGLEEINMSLFSTVYDEDGEILQEGERAVMRQAEFGDKAFQWGTNGLTGCTMVTLVSQRAANFWETYSHRDSDWIPDTDLPKPDEYNTNYELSYKAFEERVLDALSGKRPAEITEPGERTNKKYIAPAGPGTDKNLFRPEGGLCSLYRVQRRG
ncbi:hypothetical protein BDW69DRAFT_189646 [Aspergillus filifer]